MSKKTLKIEGMMCENCSAKVRNALSGIDGVVSVTADHRKGTAVVESETEIPDDTLLMAVIDAGFKGKVKKGLFK
ncbi:MAG: heavy-metal-associated domain-containing protein [Candidatus Methanomethylophilaceae archaeon]